MTRPSLDVLSAFGVEDADLLPLNGGQGTTWRAGDVALKPTGDPAETAWRADVLDTVAESSEFRVARPVRAADGSWMAEGWEAWHVVAGQEDHSRPDDVLRAGAAFHAAIADVPRPDFLDTRADPWSHGDRMAWAETPITGSEPTMRLLLKPLAEVRGPVKLPSQPLHGDLLGNVLFAADDAPAIIDWPVYFRPPGWAAAVVVADALCWYGASADLLGRWAHLPEWRQMLVRALIYRIATSDAMAGAAGPDPDVVAEYQRVVALVATLD